MYRHDPESTGPDHVAGVPDTDSDHIDPASDLVGVIERGGIDLELDDIHGPRDPQAVVDR